MKKKFIAAFAVVLSAAMLSGCSLFGAQQSTNAMGSYNFEEMRLVQLEEPAEGMDVAVFDTTEGTMTAVLYTEYAPNTISNFKKRAEEGFYNDKPFFAIQKGIYGITGASNDEGTEGLTEDGNFIPNECSVDLWPFKGALLGYSTNGTKNNEGYSDSRFFFAGAVEMTDDNMEELRGYTDTETSKQVIPEDLIAALRSRGSVAALAGNYTVFGQVISGFDTLDKILWRESDPNNMRPKEEVKILSVKLDTYSKDKYPVEEPTADKYVTAEELETAESNASSQAQSN